MSFSQRFQDIRSGFERPFWVANISEIFERISYYGAFASLAVYLQEKLNFSTQQTGTLTGKTTRTHSRKAALVFKFSQRVGLVHKLGKLGR